MHRRSGPAVCLVVSACVMAPLCIACSTGEPVPQNDAGCTDGWQDAYLENLTDRTGDVSCMGNALVDDAAAPSCVAEAPLAGQAVDHQSSDPAAGVSVTWFFDDAIDGDGDETLTSDAAGALSLDAFPVCAPLAYRALGDPNGTLPTLGQHKIYPPGDAVDADFRSVAQGTIALVTLGFGVSSEEGKGMVFGKAIACNNEDALEGVRVLIRDAECKVPDGAQSFVGYTSNRLPDPSLRATSQDGFFFAINIEPGAWVLEMYEKDGDGHRLIGSAPVDVVEDSVSLVDVRVGRSDGLVMPPECLSCP